MGIDHVEPSDQSPTPPVERKGRGRTKVVAVYVLLSLLALAVASVVAIAVVPSHVRLRIMNPSYTHWVKRGGPYKAEYYQLMVQDRNRDEMFDGLTESEFRRKYTLYESSDYRADSYRRVAAGFYCAKEGQKLLWFDKREDDFGWAVLIDNGQPQKLVLMKG
jgi:hypothetical protein